MFIILSLFFTCLQLLGIKKKKSIIKNVTQKSQIGKRI
jgi:hypothetical protein